MFSLFLFHHLSLTLLLYLFYYCRHTFLYLAIYIQLFYCLLEKLLTPLRQNVATAESIISRLPDSRKHEALGLRTLLHDDKLSTYVCGAPRLSSM